MTSQEIEAHLSGLSDAELNDKLGEAAEDLAKAARQCNGSEWHEACFAAAVLYSQEKNKRNQQRFH